MKRTRASRGLIVCSSLRRGLFQPGSGMSVSICAKFQWLQCGPRPVWILSCWCRAGVGHVSLNGALVSLPSIAAPEAHKCGPMRRASVQCYHSLWSYCPVFRVYGFQEADWDPDKLALMEFLFDTFCEVRVLGNGQQKKSARVVGSTWKRPLPLAWAGRRQ